MLPAKDERRAFEGTPSLPTIPVLPIFSGKLTHTGSFGRVVEDATENIDNADC